MQPGGKVHIPSNCGEFAVYARHAHLYLALLRLPARLLAVVDMGNLLSIIGLVLLVGATYVLLKLVKNYFGRSPFDNIPGPPPDNWIDGE